MELDNVRLAHLLDMCIISKVLQCLFCWPPCAPSINRNHGPEVVSLRGCRHDKGWIGHWSILFLALMHVSGSYPYADITPWPGFVLCIPGSGSICIPSSVRRFPVWAILVSMVEPIYILDTPSAMYYLLYFSPGSLGSLAFSYLLWDRETPPP